MIVADFSNNKNLFAGDYSGKDFFAAIQKVKSIKALTLSFSNCGITDKSL